MWDFDGTLAYRDGLWSGCLVAVLQEHEPDRAITRADVRPLLRRGFPWHTPDVAHPELSTPEAWWGVVDALIFDACRTLGIPADRARRYARLANERYIDVAGFRLFDDTVPVLRSLREEGWRHVILSNHVPELGDLVEGLELAGLIDDVLTSAMTGYEKPHPEAFALGRAAAGDPDELWMVGDNPHADVEGAESVGISAILVRTQADVPRRADDLHGVASFLVESRDG